VKKDAFKGVDISIHMDGKTYTAQIKPYSTTKIDNDVISLLDTGNVKKYDVDWMIFSHPKTNRILIFKNDPISTQDLYSFNLSSLIHEIE
jgi:pyruvate/2-oxoglutarate/acetoin dehydrogenase E1 component